MCDANSDDCRCKRLYNQISSTLENISNLIAQAIKDPSIRHQNENLAKCWEIKNCEHTDCPAYENENLRCWQVEGTFCGGEIQGKFAEKYENCVECQVFRAACSMGNDAINEQVNNLLHLMHEKEQYGEELNQELMNALTSLNIKDQALTDMTATDRLTGLQNKTCLMERLAVEVERFTRYQHPLSILMIDVDAFRKYNDAFGHLEGDLLLKKFGGIIKKSIRKVDLACRFGGDEFIVVLPDTNQKTALLVAKRILQSLKQQVLHPHHDEAKILHKTSSIGLVTASGKDTCAEDLIEKAIQAMLQARESGGNEIVIFHPPIKSTKSAA